ncbi:hypothetical protein V8D89_008227 [Ganoderma adspersum]
MGVKVRCFQCKEKISGRGTGQQHADATGHTWQPGYYCADCGETFKSHSTCKQHVRSAGVHGKKVPSTKSSTVPVSAPATPSSSSAPATPSSFKLSASATPFSLTTPGTHSSWSASDRRGIAAPREVPSNGVPEKGIPCTICSLTFPSKESLEEHFTRTSTCTKCRLHLYAFQKLKEHHCVATPETVAASSGASETGTHVENGSSSGVQCPVCKLTFGSEEKILEHSAHTFTCTKCCIHFHASEVLQDHYRTSAMHPTCRECGAGFPAVAEWATHRARCPPPKPPPADPTQSASAPGAVSDVFPFAPPSAEDEDAASSYGTNLEPSEASSPAPSSLPLIHTTVVTAQDIGDSESISDGNAGSVSRDTAETLVTEIEGPNARLLQDSGASLKADKGKGKALSNNGVATPTTGTMTLEGSQRTAAKALSFHCRSCLADPCVKPVATLCGHIFCHSCILRELETKMGCPVCQRPFLIRLQVGVRS